MAVVDDSAFSLTSYDVGAAKTWVHKHTLHAGWKEVSIKETKWKVLIQVIEEHLNAMDCIMAQQMVDARLSKKRGDTLKYAATVVEARRQKIQEQHEEKREAAPAD